MKRLSLVILTISLLPLILSDCIDNVNDLKSQNCSALCTSVKGRIVTDGGTMGLANIPLEVQWKNTPGIVGGTIRTKAITKTDSDGYYDLTFSLNDDELVDGIFLIKYSVDPSKFLVFGGPEFSLEKLSRDTIITNDNYLIPKKGFLQWNALNLNDIKGNDFFMTELNSAIGFSGNGGGAVLMWSSGLPLQSKIEIAANQSLYINTSRSKDGILSSKIDTVFVEDGATLNYTFDFNK